MLSFTDLAIISVPQVCEAILHIRSEMSHWYLLRGLWPIKTCCDETWWCHQMETFFALLALCVENSPVTGEFPAQRPVTGSFDVFFDLSLNKRLSKQSWGWWFETQLRSLWCHCNEKWCGDKPLKAQLKTGTDPIILSWNNDGLQSFWSFTKYCMTLLLLLMSTKNICAQNTNCCLHLLEGYPDSKVYGANMGPTWVLSAPDGPHVGPMNFAIRVEILVDLSSNRFAALQPFYIMHIPTIWVSLLCKVAL